AAIPLVMGLIFAAGQARPLTTIVVGGGLTGNFYYTAQNGGPQTTFHNWRKALLRANNSLRGKAGNYINRRLLPVPVRDYAGAINDVDQSIQRMPNLSEAYVNRGAALINLNRPREALGELDRAIGMGLPKIHLAYYNRAMAKEQLQDIRGAYADLRKVI